MITGELIDMGASSKDQPHVSLRLDDQLCFALYSVSHRIQTLYRPLLGALGLTYSQYLVLLVLWEKDHLSVSEVGARLFLSSATLTPLLKRMEAAGWVRRARSQEDERRVIVSLTEQGAKAKAQVHEITAEVTCAATKAVAQPEQLHALLLELRAGLQE